MCIKLDLVCINKLTNRERLNMKTLENLTGNQRVEAQGLLNALKQDHGKILEIVEYKGGDWILYAGTRHPLTGDPQAYKVTVDKFGYVLDKLLPPEDAHYQSYVASIYHEPSY